MRSINATNETGVFQERWTDVNSDDSRWTTDAKSIVYTILEDDDYTMTVYLGDEIPFDELSIDNLEIEVYVNGEYVDNVTIDEDEYGFSVRRIVFE